MSLRDVRRRTRDYAAERGEDIYSHIDAALEYLSELGSGLTKPGRKQLRRAGRAASDAADDAGDLMRANLVASLTVALGVGVLIGLMIRR